MILRVEKVSDPEEYIKRIQDRYDYYSFLELVFGNDPLAKDIIEITEVDDGYQFQEEGIEGEES